MPKRRRDFADLEARKPFLKLRPRTASKLSAQGDLSSSGGVEWYPLAMDLPSALIDRLDRTPGLVAAYVFGSRARGVQRGSSDLDVAVWLTQAPDTFDAYPFDLAADLTDLAGIEVDLVVLNRVPADLVHRVLTDGMLVAERDRSRRIALETAARREYFDMQPTWQAIRFPRAVGT